MTTKFAYSSGQSYTIAKFSLSLRLRLSLLGQVINGNLIYRHIQLLWNRIRQMRRKIPADMLNCPRQDTHPYAGIRFPKDPRHPGDGGARLRHQRNLANQRERKRMMLINQGFELLRRRLPICDLNSRCKQVTGDNVRNKNRLTKVDILRLTISYIKHLTKTLDCGTSQMGKADDDMKIIENSLEGMRKEAKIIRRRRRQHKRQRCKLAEIEQTDIGKEQRLIHELAVHVKSEHMSKDGTVLRYLLSCSSNADFDEATQRRRRESGPLSILWVPERK